ncbi:MAG: laccase domain-containing protein [Firmicutes bacterium]|nr:laccase domain-containing protein [Bacillota bacterium]
MMEKWQAAAPGMRATVAENGVLWYGFPALLAHGEQLLHGFSSRVGGVSSGAQGTLNLAFAKEFPRDHNYDDPQNVLENLRRYGAALGFKAEELVFSQQEHGVNILVATDEHRGCGVTRGRGYSNIDGLITGVRGLPLITHHADCAALFFYAPQAQLIGVAHAGWRGTIGDGELGMGKAMVRRLVSLGARAEELLCGISPSAGPCCYQVGEEVAAQFAPLAARHGEQLARPDGTGRYLLDIWQANRLMLIEAGVPAANISIAGGCTICHADIFHSHRAGHGHRGSLAAVMMLR